MNHSHLFVQGRNAGVEGTAFYRSVYIGDFRWSLTVMQAAIFKFWAAVSVWPLFVLIFLSRFNQLSMQSWRAAATSWLVKPCTSVLCDWLQPGPHQGQKRPRRWKFDGSRHLILLLLFQTASRVYLNSLCESTWAVRVESHFCCTVFSCFCSLEGGKLPVCVYLCFG